MIVFDEIVSWKNPGVIFDSRCRIRIIKLNNHGPVVRLKKYYIVASDLGANTGTSITNSAKFLIPWICEKHNISLNEMVWFENYPAYPSLDVVITKTASSCCERGCSNLIDVAWRPALENEKDHLKTFIPDII
jgi:hypothetical protein